MAESLLFVCKKYKADLIGYVFMPNHIHLLLFLEVPANLSSLMRDFKKFTATAIRKQLEAEKRFDLLEKIRYVHGKQKFKIWMDRFDDFFINNPRSLMTKLNYIHENPVRKRLATIPTEYLYSSAKFYNEEQPVFLKVVHFLNAIGAANHYSYGRIY